LQSDNRVPGQVYVPFPPTQSALHATSYEAFAYQFWVRDSAAVYVVWKRRELKGTGYCQYCTTPASHGRFSFIPLIVANPEAVHPTGERIVYSKPSDTAEALPAIPGEYNNNLN
jgi:hypothetical protein